MKKDGKNNNQTVVVNHGDFTRCRCYVRENRYYEVPLDAELVKVISYQRKDGSIGYAEKNKNDTVMNGVKFTINGKNPFTILLANEDIVCHKGKWIYLDNKGNPQTLPDNREGVKVMKTSDGKIFQVKEDNIQAQKWSVTGKDGKVKNLLVPNSEIFFAVKLTSKDGRVLGYSKEDRKKSI